MGAGVSICPALEVMLITMPEPCCFQNGRQSLMSWSGAYTLQRNMRSMSSSGVSSNASMCPGPM